jgi:hypothetical protein
MRQRSTCLDAVRERAGKQGVPSYIEEAVQRQLQREAIDEYIAAAEAEDGPLDSAAMEEKAECVRAYHAAHRGDSAPVDAA